MGGSQSSPPPPPTHSKRRWSKECPPSFALRESEYYQLHQSIIEFLKDYEDRKDSLDLAVAELQEIIAQIEQIEAKRKTGRIAAISTSAVGAGLAVASAPLTGGASLVVLGLGAGSGIAGAATGIGVKATHSKETKATQEKRQSEADRFIREVRSLELHMDKVHALSERLRRTEGNVHERELLLKLENEILKFKLNFLQQQGQIREGSLSQAIEEMKTSLTRLSQLILVFETVLKRLDIRFKN